MSGAYLDIISQRALAQGVCELRLAWPDDRPQPRPGQFVNVYLNDASRLLPRPLSVCDWEKGTLVLVYAVVGAGTAILAGCAAGTALRVSVPLGNGFTVDAERPALLVGGGLGAAPLAYLAKRLPRAQAALGFASQPLLTDRFPGAAIATDDGRAGFKGNVIDLLKSKTIPDGACLYACGPRPMLRGLAAFASARGLAAQVSLEERMGCGYGACVGCTVKTTRGSRKVCEDGPVFGAEEVLWDD